MNKLQTTFLGVTFPNPLILPSGIIQEIKDHKRAEEQGIGGITLKSLTVEPREGNPLPRIAMYKHGYLNSVGLRNPGIQKGVKQVADFKKQSKVPVIASIFATNIKDFKLLAEKIEKANADCIELNLSCPNTVDEMGEPLGLGVCSTEKAVAEIRKVIKKKTKILAKLSPNVPSIKEVAKAAESSGADGISAINTVGPGMIINLITKKPLLGNREGGVSGAGIKPIAIRCIYDIYESVKIPILGMGGISTWEDTIEMMLAGATLVGVGSAVYFNKTVYEDIKKGLVDYMEKEGVKSLKEIVGKGH
jgi:dihydroorotate dehydrogenase (NAD+) catalytic subunit